ncbi:DnaD domain protein [Paenibacillus gansuensis]|uniref:DnaD domain protein n=1 Tax=Paenibacillus gansuensis TaxID=306542 RepID=A0ABW5PAT6_9BACL
MSSGTKRMFAQGLFAGLLSGSVSVPYYLLTSYRKMKLSDLEAMVLIQLLAFREKEMNEFPTFEEMQDRLSASGDAVIKALQRLLRDGFIAIDEEVDESSGIQYERYNLEPLYERIAETLAEETAAKAKEEAKSVVTPLKAAAEQAKLTETNVFVMFEREFARPLSPMECETISSWLDQDRYPLELITAALKEAVFAGKLHFRYIDRILLEWSRNRVFTAEQAKEYTQRFRTGSR